MYNTNVSFLKLGARFFSGRTHVLGSTGYRVVQLKFTPEIEVSYMMFESYLSIFSMASLKQHI